MQSGLTNPTNELIVNYLDVSLNPDYDWDDLDLEHSGVKGQKWGLRRYQNPDMSLTPEGRIHYGVGPARDAAKKVGSAIRKRVLPTEEDTIERYEKAKRRADLKQMRKDASNLNREALGLRKDINKMSDAEIDQYLNRLRKESSIKELERELHPTIGNRIGKPVGQLADAVGTGVTRGLSRGIENKVSSLIGRNAQEKLREAEAANKLSKLKSGEQDPEKYLKDLETQLKTDILSGDSKTSKKAKKKLNDYVNAGKGKYSSSDKSSDKSSTSSQNSTQQKKKEKKKRDTGSQSSMLSTRDFVYSDYRHTY